MRKLTILLFLGLVVSIDFVYAESPVIGPKIGITYPLSLEASSRYSSPWQNFRAFVRFGEGNLAVQGEFEYLRSRAVLEFRSFLGKTYWSTGGEVCYIATPFWVSLITKVSFIRAGIGFGVYPVRENFEGGVAEDAWAYYYIANHSFSDTFYRI